MFVLGLYVQSQNARHAKDLAATVVQFDKGSNAPDPNETILKDYVSTHMGATVTYTLQGSYDRTKAAADASAAAQAASSQVYADAQRACSGKTDSLTQARCNTAYIQQHLSTAPSATPVPEPKLADYQVTLQAPFWTADLAGALTLGAIAALAAGLVLGKRRR